MSTQVGMSETEKTERLNYITATDVPCILGISPWASAVDVWLYKTKQAEQPDIPDSLAEKGVFLEPAILQWFGHKAGLEVVEEKGFLKHPKHPFMAAHTDGRIKNQPWLVETKTSIANKGWGEQGEFLVPDYYLVQTAHEVACDDAEGAYIAVLIGNHDLRYYRYERNLKLEQAIEPKLLDFWKHVQSETAPTPKTGQDILSLYGYQDHDQTVVADADMDEVIDQLREVKARVDEAQKEQKKLEDQIKVYMGQAQRLCALNGHEAVVWKTTTANRLDTKKIKAEHPDLCQNYLTQSQSRRFTVK